MNPDFAVFILTHGRPDNVRTYAMLRRQGYTGPIYLIVDNEDSTVPAYQERYGDQVIMFDKAAVAERVDQADQSDDRRAIVFARHASFDIARELGLTYFLQLDDDYSSIRYRFGSDLTPQDRAVKNLDKLFALILEFFSQTPALTIAMAQGGDSIGGLRATAMAKLWLKRKAMNSFFCKTDHPINFVGRMNEDTTTYVTEGRRGKLFFTFFSVYLSQADTQSGAGGMSESYRDSGTYMKTFYTLMSAPSCTTIWEMGPVKKRLHHRISWPHTTPQILHARYRRVSND